MSLTQATVLTAEFMAALSMELLPQPDDNYPFYANGPIASPNEVSEPGVTSLQFNRPVLPTGTYTETSRRGTEGTPIGATSQAITMTTVTLTTREYLGPHDGANISPFGITEFAAKRSKHDLLQLIGGFLRRDRLRFLDFWCRDSLLAATTVVTPDGSAEGAITTGQAASAAWLRRFSKQMIDSKVPSYNGRYRLWITSKQQMELMGDSEYREWNRYKAVNPAFTGHVDSFLNFDIGVATSTPTKGVGAGGAVIAHQAVAHGPAGLAHGEAMPVTPAQDPVTDFGRQERVIWKSHEAFGTLELDFLVRGITT